MSLRYIVAACLVAIGIAASNARADTFHVNNQSPAATDKGPGTEAIPYRTIKAAMARHGGAGITILVRPGVYREQVSVSASGAEGAPFEIRASGPGVTIEGSESFAAPSLWISDSGDVWLARTVTWLPQQVFVDGKRLARAAAEPQSLPRDSYTYVPGAGLYVNAGGENPGVLGARVGRRSYAFRIDGKSHVRIHGFEVRRSEKKGLFITNSTNVEVLATNISLTGTTGIQINGGHSHLIAGCHTWQCGDHGIQLGYGMTASTIRDNWSYDNARPDVRAANGIHLFGSTRNRIERNRTFRNQDTGLQFAGGSNDNLCLQNVTWNNGDHGADMLHSSNVVHVGGVSYGNFRDGYSIEGQSPGCGLFNCISAENGTALRVDPVSSAGWTSDHNVFWNSNGVSRFVIKNVIHTSLDAYSSASGQDTSSHQADPLFVNPSAADFRLLPSSPAIDAGTSAPADWPESDALHHPRYDDPDVPNSGAGPVPYADIGVLERSASEIAWVIGGNATIEEAYFARVAAAQSVEGTVASGAPKAASIEVEVPASHASIPNLALSRAFPNPSRGAVSLHLDLPRAADVRWSVFDVQGRELWTESRTLAAGRTALAWPGVASHRGNVPRGAYLARVEVEGQVIVRRWIQL